MLHIQCDHCGQMLKGKDVKVTTFDAYVGKAKYKDYAVVCTKCDGIIVWDRYVQKAAENKAKAMGKLSKKTGKPVKQITEEDKYNAIMRKVGKRAKEVAVLYKGNPVVKHKDLCQAIDELSPKEKAIVLAYEDKLDMALFKIATKKPTKHIRANSILLLTQAIIECAIADNDEEFFKSEYGATMCETYNLALTIHTSHDYGITADLLLEKMRKNAIRIKGEQENA